MKKNFTIVAVGVFLAITSSALIIFSMTAATAHAYAIPTTGSVQSATSASLGSGYNFSDSFKNLVSPFTGFFQGLQSTVGSGLNVQTQGPTINGSSSLSVSVNVGATLQTGMEQFDMWFYHTTGISIVGISTGIINFFSAIVGFLNGIINWVVGMTRK